MGAQHLDIAELQEKLRRFAAERDWEQFHSPKNLAMALSVEASELVELFQWLTESQSADLDDATKAAVAEEIADVQIYLVRLADRLDIDIPHAVDEKLAVNARKYPAEAWMSPTAIIFRGMQRTPGHVEDLPRCTLASSNM